MNAKDRETELIKALLDIGGRCTARPADVHARTTLAGLYGPDYPELAGQPLERWVMASEHTSGA